MHTGAGMNRAARDAGAQGFVTKSDVALTLLKAVDAVLRGETFFTDYEVPKPIAPSVG
jgi:DNA-binding NarL/FixJ family response regulator